MSQMLEFGVLMGPREVSVFQFFTILEWVTWQVFFFIKEVRGQKKKYISNYLME